jgi:hypothetical protein
LQVDTHRIQHIVLKWPHPATEAWLLKLEELVGELVGPEVTMERTVYPASSRTVGSYMLETEEMARKHREAVERGIGKQ